MKKNNTINYQNWKILLMQTNITARRINDDDDAPLEKLQLIHHLQDFACEMTSIEWARVGCL